MLINSKTELNKFLPSSVVDDPNDIAMLIDRAEDVHLRPVIGDSLYEYVCAYHVDNKTERDKNDDALLRLCQSAAIYFALADNVGILSISYNVGGGFSVVSTDSYTPADEKEKDRLERDLWKNAWRDIDRIIDLLIKDAMKGDEESRWATMWRESEWFYYQGDIIIPTAKEARRYAKADEKIGRKEFVDMLGDLRFVQMAFISQAIGQDFLDWLIKVNNGDTEAAVEMVNAGGEHVVTETLKLLRMALMAAMRYRRDGKGRDENDANLALFRATEYIRQHQDAFGEIIKTSPLYVAPPAEDATDEDKHKHKHHHRHCDCECGNPGSKTAALFVPFM